MVSLAVGIVALAVQVYSTAYLKGDPRYPSYAAFVSLFTAAMLLVVFADDLIVLLVGWEVMGVCSYFLIGHHWEQEARGPARSRRSWSPGWATSASCSASSCSRSPPARSASTACSAPPGR